LVLVLAAGILGLGGAVVYKVRRGGEKRTMFEEKGVCARINEEEKDAVLKCIESDVYEEIPMTGKREIARAEQEIAAALEHDIGSAIPVQDGENLRREFDAELREKVRTDLLEEIRRQLVTSENAALREEARGKLLEELSERLRKEVGGQLEMEALQDLTRAVHGEVRAEHAKQLKERALKDLDERIRQEVAIRERAMLFANARASLKETIEKEIREEEGDALRNEIRAAIMAAIRSELGESIPDAHSSPGRVDALLPEGPREVIHEVLRDVRGAMRKIDESESLQSLAKTVDLLKSSQRDSPYFNLNAAQTSSMIEYLDNVSGRMQGYVTEVKSGIGRLYRSIERLLREQQEGTAGAVPIEKERLETDTIKTEEPEIVVGSE
jgi:hypothetical protein